MRGTRSYDPTRRPAPSRRAAPRGAGPVPASSELPPNVGAMPGTALDHPGSDGTDIVWEPSPERIAASGVTRFRRWLAEHRGLTFASYEELWQWSVDDLEGFWSAIWEFGGVRAAAPPTAVLAERRMPGARWFPGARLNFAEGCLEGHEGTAIVFVREDGLERTLTFAELRAQVAAAAAGLRRLGVQAGDRVAGVLPNCPEAIVAMLASAGIGAIWTSCAPENGPQAVLDRFAQVEPSVLLGVDGYVFAGRQHDVRETFGRVAAALPSVRHRVVVPYVGADLPPDCLPWASLLGESESEGEGDAGAGAPAYEALPFDHPLWILYSSGTTGPPKAIVHGHGGIVLEHLKYQLLHHDMGFGERCVALTLASTNWVIWNMLVATLLVGTTIVLYDGSPNHPGPEVVWQLAGRVRATHVRLSAAWIQRCMRDGLSPKALADLSSLRMITSTGSPLPAEGFRWLVDEVGSHVCPVSGSGGTDVCTGFVGGVTTEPIRAGEIQCRALGVAAYAFDDEGHAVVDEVGELVVTEPMPSMPLYLWGDPDGARLHDTYFSMYPGVWRHGDWVRFTPRGGCLIYGRSDATLNRGGVRMGTSEFYRALERVPEVVDSLVVDTSFAGNDGELLLFVVPAPGVELDDALVARLRAHLRAELSPRHVPSRILAVDELPETITGKRCEVPVKRILQGMPLEQAVTLSSIRNPDALTWFVRLAEGGNGRPG